MRKEIFENIFGEVDIYIFILILLQVQDQSETHNSQDDEVSWPKFQQFFLVLVMFQGQGVKFHWHDRVSDMKIPLFFIKTWMNMFI